MITSTPIDRSRYMVAPRTSVRRTLSLGRLLVRHTPKQASGDLAVMTSRLVQSIDTSAKAIRARHREYGPSVVAAESELDIFVDSLERMRKTRLEHCASFDCALVRRLAAEPVVGGFDYGHALDRANLAVRVYNLLYADGVDYCRLGYEEQNEHMQTLSTLIDEEGFADAIDDLIGADLGDALRDGHRRYESMVEARNARTRGSEIDLRQIGLDLQRSIQNYLIALLATIRDEDPDNVAVVRHALRPIDALRDQILAARSRRTGQPVEPSDPAALDELVTEQQAVDAELGLAAEDGTEDQNDPIE